MGSFTEDVVETKGIFNLRYEGYFFLLLILSLHLVTCAAVYMD